MGVILNSKISNQKKHKKGALCRLQRGHPASADAGRQSFAFCLSWGCAHQAAWIAAALVMLTRVQRVLVLMLQINFSSLVNLQFWNLRIMKISCERSEHREYLSSTILNPEVHLIYSKYLLLKNWEMLSNWLLFN